MLYLAEVHKKSGFMSGKTELKLLARQQSEQNWSAMPSDEAIPTEEANNFNAGALVFIELNPSRKIQNIYEAAKQLVGILQNFSRQREKFRAQEEEIEGWKQSLIYQSQELTRRELELETQHEELERLEEASKMLEQKRLEAKATSEEVQQLQEEVERSRQELEDAWEHLRREMHQLGEHQTQRATVLDKEQVRSIEDLLDRLLEAITPSESVQGQLTFALELIDQRVAELDQYWQQLEQLRNSAQQQQVEVDRQAYSLENSWQEWQQAQDALEQARTELKLQQQMLSLKEDSAQILALRAQAQSELYQQLYQLATGFKNENLGAQIDVWALEEMPLEELSITVESLQQGLESSSRFVHDQEEELALQQQTSEELKERISQASEYDRLSLEGDLEFEQQSYQMLNETLVGQRRSLREREEILDLHRAVLLRRQEQKQENQNLEPILLQLSSQRQQQMEELQKLESQIEQIRLTIQQSQETIECQARDHEVKRSELKQLELTLQHQRGIVSELWGKANAYQEILQPMQDSLSELRQKLAVMEANLGQTQHLDNEPKQVIEEIRRSITALAQAPELAAS